MSRKKIKIAIEAEGKEPRVFEANGIAAAMLTDGNDSDHHGMSICICGNMSTQDLLHLHDAVTGEMVEQLEETIVKNLSPADILKVLLGGKKHGSD